MSIYGFEKGKETEKAIKEFLGLPTEVAGAGKIDAFYAGYSIEIKRGACALYVGKRFNRYRNASNATEKLSDYAFLYEDTDEGTALERSERVAYSIDGTVEATYILSTVRFLHYVSITNAAKLYRQGKGKMLRIVPNKEFMALIQECATPLGEWKERHDRRRARG